MQTKKNYRILILGAGNFGTCLAQHLGNLGHAVWLWSRSTSTSKHINQHHHNPHYLSMISLPESVKGTEELTEDLFKNMQVIIFAVPTQSLRFVLKNIYPWLKENHLIINTAKGIETTSLKLPCAILADVLEANLAANVVVMGGPNFAIEIAEGRLTAAAMGSLNSQSARLAQQIFHASHFRIYTNSDPLGMQVAGALKNVIALGAGICTGLNFKANSLAALVTRGLAEMTRLGVALGADLNTFMGLSGVGDLFLTCSSPKSRNYTVGYRLGQGESLKSITAHLTSVAEGIETTKAAYELSLKLKIRMPITTSIYQVLYENKPLEEALLELLTQHAKAE